LRFVGVGIGTDNDVWIGFNDMIVPELFDKLAADIGMTVVDVNFVLVLLGCGRFVNEILQLLVSERVGHLIFKGSLLKIKL
jgi:hypothetical protein